MGAVVLQDPGEQLQYQRFVFRHQDFPPLELLFVPVAPFGLFVRVRRRHRNDRQAHPETGAAARLFGT